MNQVHTQSILNVVGPNSVSSTIFQTLYFEFGDLFKESLADALDLAIPSSVCDYDLTFNIEDAIVQIKQIVFFSSVELSISVSYNKEVKSKSWDYITSNQKLANKICKYYLILTKD
jgi:hypothetical protein